MKSTFLKAILQYKKETVLENDGVLENSCIKVLPTVKDVFSITAIKSYALE